MVPVFRRRLVLGSVPPQVMLFQGCFFFLSFKSIYLSSKPIMGSFYFSPYATVFFFGFLLFRRMNQHRVFRRILSPCFFLALFQARFFMLHQLDTFPARSNLAAQSTFSCRGIRFKNVFAVFLFLGTKESSKSSKGREEIYIT